VGAAKEPLVVDDIIQVVRHMLSGRVVQTIGGPGLKASAVLLLLYPKDGDHCVLFNKRTYEVEFNKGEMCFPGGARDPEDSDLAATALREAHEEMGICPEHVTVLGELDHTTTRAGFVIHPFVGTIPYPYDFKPNSVEVAEVLEVPISSLLDGRSIRDEAHVQPDGQLEKIRSYAYGRHLIYGATARILRQFLELLEGSGWPKEAPSQ
jgi:8-oxo-dGTP pyrophosphatase MutT (NUDIX family)